VALVAVPAVLGAGVPRFEQPCRPDSIRPADHVILLDTLATQDNEKVYIHMIHRGYRNPVESPIRQARMGRLGRSAGCRVARPSGRAKAWETGRGDKPPTPDRG
jgi:hypothetical protein